MSENQGLQEFTEAYTRLLVAVWTDERTAGRLRSDPRAVAADAGLVIPDGVEITVVDATGAPAGDPKAALADYYADFREGLAGGAVTLTVPQAPPIDTQDLTSDALSEVAGGDVTCCCCPCCCCC
ncbi:MAG: hypothetical protein ACFN04_06095 [Propionibacterium acidifaciens]